MIHNCWRLKIVLFSLIGITLGIAPAPIEAQETPEQEVEIWFGMPISITYQIPFENNRRPIYLDSPVRDLLMNIAVNSTLNIGTQIMLRFAPEFSVGLESGIAFSYYPQPSAVDPGREEYSPTTVEGEGYRGAHWHCEYHCSRRRGNYYLPISVDSPLRAVMVFTVPDIIDIDLYGGLYFSDIIKPSRRIVFDIGTRVGVPLGPGALFTEVNYVFPGSISFSNRNTSTVSGEDYYQNALNVGLGYRVVF